MTPISGTPRNVMSLLHKSTFQDPYFARFCTVILGLYSVSGAKANYFGAKNFVYSVTANYEAFYKILIDFLVPKITTVTPPPQLKFGLDKIIVIRENSLNELISFA